MRCIFCKEQSNTSRSVEHIIPESIGNKRWVLPKGVVCDKCNNYFAIKVEAPILNHSSFSNVRAYHQVPNKKGKFPPFKGVTGGTDIEIALKRDKDNKIKITPTHEKQTNEFNIEYSKFLNGEDFNAFIFKVEIEPPKEDMSRFLAKMALEMVAYNFLQRGDNVESLVDEEFFDPIRKFARYGNKPKTWIYNSRRIFPMNTLMKDKEGKFIQVGYGCDLFLNRRRETYFIFIFYGVEFIINIGGNSIQGYKEWLEENNYISPALERNGSKVIVKKNGSNTKYYIDGNLNSKDGYLFDIKQMKNKNSG